MTSTKPAERFMKRVTVFDDAAGHALGWDPNGVTTSITITEPAVIHIDFSFISAVTRNNPLDNCWATTGFTPGQFFVTCQSAPGGGEELHYIITNLPAHTS